MAAVLLFGCAASGCGGDGPTGLGPTSLPELFGDQLLMAEGSTVSVGTLASTPLIGIYFADRACSACGGFTPLLVDAYSQLREDGRSFQVVLVSPGISMASLLEYMVDSEMPWLAVPPGSDRTNALIQRYNVRWIPTLVIIDGAARTISLTGRNEIAAKGTGAYDDWLATRAGG